MSFYGTYKCSSETRRVLKRAHVDRGGFAWNVLQKLTVPFKKKQKNTQTLTVATVIFKTCCLTFIWLVRGGPQPSANTSHLISFISAAYLIQDAGSYWLWHLSLLWSDLVWAALTELMTKCQSCISYSSCRIAQASHSVIPSDDVTLTTIFFTANPALTFPLCDWAILIFTLHKCFADYIMNAASKLRIKCFNYTLTDINGAVLLHFCCIAVGRGKEMQTFLSNDGENNHMKSLSHAEVLVQ